MEKQNPNDGTILKSNEAITPQPADDKFRVILQEEIKAAGGEYEEDPACKGAVGKTMFDLPNSKDNMISVLLPLENIRKLPSQSIVKIGSRSKDRGGDGREYQGIVIEGPFHEPDGLRADSPMIITPTVRGTVFMPKYHGRVVVEIIGEIVDDTTIPPRFRPLPNSPVFALGTEETAAALKVGGDTTLGLVIGHDDIEVKIPSNKKSLFARHFGVLGTTGGGKSTTVSGMINELQKANAATILIDTEGEYTHLNQPTEDKDMIKALEKRKKKPEGVKNTHIYHLVGRETNNPEHPNIHTFSLKFDQLSPYLVMEILELNEAQQDRYLKAYELARQILMTLKIFPRTEKEKEELMELDEMEEGFPCLTLEMMYDIVQACTKKVAKELRNEDGEINLYIRTKEFLQEKERFTKIVENTNLPDNYRSWGKVQGKLGQLLRLKIFDNKTAEILNYSQLTQPGQVSVVDLSDTDSPQINNLVIAELLRGVLEQQNENYKFIQTKTESPRRVMVIIEEAHEFLSSERIKQMPVLFQQVARIARRGRKRWLGLTFVTQLPQHLPDEVLGLINNYILHKISDANVISRLKRSIGGIDDGLWQRLPNLTAGQAVITTTSLARPLLVAVDPTPCKLLMVD